MGLRTRNHLIEEESRDFFKKSMPNFWVYRDKGSDYGIDCEVEIFDESGNPTGLVFWVQLKGTDSNLQKNISTLYLKKDKFYQFLEYDIPVLIARYSSKRQIMYVRWAKNVQGVDESKNIRIDFPEVFLFTSATPDKILNYLRKQNRIKHGRLDFPIKTFITKTITINNSPIPYSNLLIIRKCIEDLPKYFSLTKDESEAYLFIEVSSKGIIMNLTDTAFSEMSMSFSDPENTNYVLLTNFTLITLSKTLFNVGKIELGNAVIFDNSLLPIILSNKNFASEILEHLLAGDYFTKTMSGLNKSFQERSDNNLLQIITNVLLLHRKENLNENELKYVEDFLLGEIEISKKTADPFSTGIAMYNLANHYRSLSKFHPSLAFYLQARKYNSSYKNQHYYYYELAGVLFLLGRYHFASWMYTKSIQLNTDYNLAKALLADCLIHCGKYKEAIAVLDQYLREEKDLNHIDEWSLKSTIFSTLITIGYPDVQKRDPSKADFWNVRQDFEKAIDFDLLSALAWFNMGVKNVQSGDPQLAFTAFTLAALLCNNDIESWVNATLLALNKEIDRMFLAHVIKCAYFYNGQNYLIELSIKLKDQIVEDHDQVLELVDRIIMDKPTPPKIIRKFKAGDERGNSL